jgi:hypothetical protein
MREGGKDREIESHGDGGSETGRSKGMDLEHCKTEPRKADSTHKDNKHALDAHAYAKIYTHAMK